MISPRRRARETALKALYQADILKLDYMDVFYKVLGQTVYAPVMEPVAKEFLKKVSSVSEVISGRVEDFVFNFAESTSTLSKNKKSEEELMALAEEVLEEHFPRITKNLGLSEDLERFYKKLRSRYFRLNSIKEFSTELVDKVSVHRNELDNVISETSKNWTLDRIAVIDLCILRLSVSEFFYFESIPVNATINEAIELAKKYSDGRSYEFINGILHRISKDARTTKIEKDRKEAVK